MHKRPLTWTGRGLRLASLGEVILAATAVLYLLSRSGKLAALGFVVTGFVGFLSIQRMFIGRREFGPSHQRLMTWGLALFMLGAFFLVYAFLASLSTLPETLQVRDLRPPVLGLALGLVCETTSGALLLWNLAGSRRHTNVVGYGVLGSLVAGALFIHGQNVVSDVLASTNGGELANVAEANIRVMNFMDTFLPWVMAGFLVTRVAAWHLVGKARKEVEAAEHDAMVEENASAATIPASSEASEPSP